MTVSRVILKDLKKNKDTLGSKQITIYFKTVLKKLKIFFIIFSLLIHIYSSRCTHGDFLKVYSEGGTHGPGPPGINEYSAWSRILCGNRADAPPALYSHGPLMVLELQSGEKASNASGFIGTYRFIDRRK